MTTIFKKVIYLRSSIYNLLHPYKYAKNLKRQLDFTQAEYHRVTQALQICEQQSRQLQRRLGCIDTLRRKLYLNAVEEDELRREVNDALSQLCSEVKPLIKITSSQGMLGYTEVELSLSVMRDVES